MSKVMSVSERDSILRLLSGMEASELDDITSSDPEWSDRLEGRLRKLAIGKLKVDKECSEIAKIDAQIASLESRKKALESAVQAKMPFAEKRGGYDDSCPRRISLCAAVAKIADKLRRTEQKKCKTGAAILAVKQKYHKKQMALAYCDTRDQVVAKKVLD